MLLRYLCLLPFLFLFACDAPEQQRGDFAIPVRTQAVTEETIVDQIELVGNLLANESVEIRPEVAGILEEVLFEEGDEVKKGMAIARIDREELGAEYSEAEANLRLAKSNYDRVEKLFKQRTISRQEYDEARRQYNTARAIAERIASRLEETEILAPFDGRMGERHVSPGQYVDSAVVLAELVDATPVKAEFMVPERFVSELDKGKKVKIEVGAYPNDIFEGEVYFIAPSVDPATRTILLKATVPNEQHLLKPGMFASLNLILSEEGKSVVIPEEALTLISQKPAVFVVSDGKAEMRRVKTGIRAPGKIQILEGLQSGETLITAGLQKIRDGVPVMDSQRPKPEGGAPAPGEA